MRFRVVLALLAAVLPTAVLAQRQQPGSEEGFVKEKPTLGDPLPDLTVYDPDGKEFKLSSLRGHYTVLTFGCLT